MKTLGTMVKVLVMGLMAVAGAQAVAAPSALESRLAAIRGLALRCSVQPTFVKPNGSLAHGQIRSVCPQLEVQGTTAVFHFPAGTLQVVVHDSALSDGGDLNTVILVDERGRQAVLADNVLAFSDPVFAILGQDALRLPRVPGERI